jgi:quinol-cytochrome oxidoreductase complex cytochrome b subunit
MEHDDIRHDGSDDPDLTPWWKTRSGVVLCGFLLIAGFYLLTEHTAHVFGALPYLLIAACPLMHLFMHHGHGGHGPGHPSRPDQTGPGAGGRP